MKIKLLNDGGYYGLDNVKFPVVVDICKNDSGKCRVSGAELINLGGKVGSFSPTTHYFFHPRDIEAIDEN